APCPRSSDSPPAGRRGTGAAGEPGVVPRTARVCLTVLIALLAAPAAALASEGGAQAGAPPQAPASSAPEGGATAAPAGSGGGAVAPGPSAPVRPRASAAGASVHAAQDQGAATTPDAPIQVGVPTEGPSRATTPAT